MVEKKFKLTVIFSGGGQRIELEDRSFVVSALESFVIVVVLFTLGKAVMYLRLVLNLLYPQTDLKLTMCLGWPWTHDPPALGPKVLGAQAGFHHICLRRVFSWEILNIQKTTEFVALSKCDTYLNIIR